MARAYRYVFYRLLTMHGPQTGPPIAALELSCITLCNLCWVFFLSTRALGCPPLNLDPIQLYAAVAICVSYVAHYLLLVRGGRSREIVGEFRPGVSQSLRACFATYLLLSGLPFAVLVIIGIGGGCWAAG